MTEPRPIFFEPLTLSDASEFKVGDALLNTRSVAHLYDSLAKDDGFGTPFFSRLAVRELVAALKAMPDRLSFENLLQALQSQVASHVSNTGDSSDE
jgi:hypothetical protein